MLRRGSVGQWRKFFCAVFASFTFIYLHLAVGAWMRVMGLAGRRAEAGEGGGGGGRRGAGPSVVSHHLRHHTRRMGTIHGRRLGSVGWLVVAARRRRTGPEAWVSRALGAFTFCSFFPAIDYKVNHH